MLSLRILPRNINYCLKQSSQQLYTSFKLLSVKDPSSSSSSSSSDSSDSDSDKEKQLQKQIPVKEETDTSNVQSTSDTNTRLNALLQKITESTKNREVSDAIKATNTLNVALKPKKERFQKTKKKLKKKEPFEKQLKDAAKNVAKVIKGDSDKTELELLSKALNIDKASTDTKDSPTSTVAPEKEPAPSSSLGDLLTGMKIERSTTTSDLTEKQKLMASKLAYSKEPSVARSLLYTKSKKMPPRNFPSREPELKAKHAGLGIFKHMSEQENKDTHQLSTWQDMEKKEIKLASYRSPQNVFQELILWTEQGKIWNFPINNEQGMEKEEEVHFSEHVFLERHLKGWCPKKGPIRHFMELVCTGLSKNPYMTVEEKFEHITWYKTYFEDKKDLLIELGVADNTMATGVATEKKKEIAA